MLKILFICIGNTCRSPMAEAMVRSLADGRLEVFSAGLMPTGRVAPEVIDLLSARGIDCDALESKGLGDVDLAGMDVIVSLTGRHGLSILPRHLRARQISWDIPDPYGEGIEAFEAVYDLLDRRLRELLRELGER